MSIRLKKLQSVTTNIIASTDTSLIKERAGTPDSQMDLPISGEMRASLGQGEALQIFSKSTTSKMTSLGSSVLPKIVRLKAEGTKQRSLIETLKLNRAHKEQLEQEREASKSFISSHQNIPKECDSKGTAIRIRPQTPKLNLLNTNRRAPQKPNMRLTKPIEREVKQQDEYLKLEDLGDDRDDLSKSSGKEVKTVSDEEEMEGDCSKENNMLFSNYQDQCLDILDEGEVSSAIGLNEKFLSRHLGIDEEELGQLKKIELRVDTQYHNLQVTGQILCSLEYLKLNDSIIKSFNDVGTAFKSLKILYLARCEMKDIQSIQALEELRELYISYNEIKELFSLQFLTHLEVLDMEGNNIESPSEMFYLRLSKNLVDVTFKYNPVCKEITYYSELQKNVPQLETLDEEPVNEGFYDRKALDSLNQPTKQPLPTYEDIVQDELVMQFASIDQFLSQEQFQIAFEALEAIDKEPENEEILVKAIKNQSKEQKAEQSYSSNIEQFDSRPQSALRRPSTSGGPGFRKTFTEGFDSRGGSIDLKNKNQNVYRASMNSFFKGAKSTAASSAASFRSMVVFNNPTEQPDNDNGASDLIANNDQVMAGNPLSILRRRGGSTNASRFIDGARVSASNNDIPKDIFSLINDFNKETTSFRKVISRDKIRTKITEGGAKPEIFDYEQVQKVVESRNAEQTPQASSQSLNFSLANFRKSLNSGFGTSGGPIKANRVISKNNISFTKKS